MNAAAARREQDIVLGKAPRNLTATDIKNLIKEHIASKSPDYFIIIDYEKNNILYVALSDLRILNYDVKVDEEAKLVTVSWYNK